MCRKCETDGPRGKKTKGNDLVVNGKGIQTTSLGEWRGLLKRWEVFNPPEEDKGVRETTPEVVTLHQLQNIQTETRDVSFTFLVLKGREIRYFCPVEKTTFYLSDVQLSIRTSMQETGA